MTSARTVLSLWTRVDWRRGERSERSERSAKFVYTFHIRFPELPLILRYFSECQTWLTGLTLGLGEVCRQDKMVDYSGHTGTCQPHRDFGFVFVFEKHSLYNQNSIFTSKGIS